MILTVILLSDAIFTMDAHTYMTSDETCKYAHICRLYDDSSVTCHSDEEASDYCGAYRDFDKHMVISEQERKVFTR